MKLLYRYGIGPRYRSTNRLTTDTNWTVQVYEYLGWTVYLDRQHIPKKRFEVFVEAPCGLWFVGDFCVSGGMRLRTWADAERRTRWLMDKWIETWGAGERGTFPARKVPRWDGSKRGRRYTSTEARIACTASTGGNVR